MTPSTDGPRFLEFLRSRWPLAAVLLLGAFLRLHDLGGESLTIDEGWTAITASRPISADVREILRRDNDPPLYMTSMLLWVHAFGASEAALRFPSAAMGILSIFLIYQLGCLLFGARAGLVSAMLLSLSTFHLYYSQQARCYAYFCFFTLLSFHGLVRMLKNPSRGNALSYVLATALLAHTHMFACFLILAQNACVFSLAWPRRDAAFPGLRYWLLTQAAVALLVAPRMAVTAMEVAKVYGHYWALRPSAADLWSALVDYGGRSRALLLAMLAFSAFGSLRSASSDGPPRRRLLLWSWFLFPVCLPFAISLVSRPVFVNRYTIPSCLALYLLAGAGAAAVKPAGLRRGAIGLLLFLSLRSAFVSMGVPHKAQWREAAAFIDARAAAGDLVLVSSGYALNTAFRYYSRSPLLSRRAFPLSPKDVGRFLADLGEGRRVWVLVLRSRSEDSRVQRILASRSYEEADRKEFYRLKLALFARAQARPPRRGGLRLSVIRP